ncbi:unnamed protein product [Somion occarium]|uniref:Uncharacterized protein n=1 Tax=Somion occarium TaxID=3059160 RepID=A0ABP1E5I6_9APHY
MQGLSIPVTMISCAAVTLLAEFIILMSEKLSLGALGYLVSLSLGLVPYRRLLIVKSRFKPEDEIQSMTPAQGHVCHSTFGILYVVRVQCAEFAEAIGSYCCCRIVLQTGIPLALCLTSISAGFGSGLSQSQASIRHTFQYRGTAGVLCGLDGDRLALTSSLDIRWSRAPVTVRLVFFDPDQIPSTDILVISNSLTSRICGDPDEAAGVVYKSRDGIGTCSDELLKMNDMSYARDSIGLFRITSHCHYCSKCVGVLSTRAAFVFALRGDRGLERPLKLQYTRMSLESGLYIISSQVENRYVGQNLAEGPPLVPKDIFALPEGVRAPRWIVERNDKGYRLVADRAPTGVLEDRVVALVIDRATGIEDWILTAQPQHGENVYIIERQDRSSGWVVKEDGDSTFGDPILAKPLIATMSLPPQYLPTELFTFVRIDRED